MPSRILVGIDGSLASRAAVSWALERARSIRTGVVLLIVVDDEWGAMGERDLGELRATAEGVAVREREFARERAGSVEVTAAIAVGAPMLVLASEASAFESVVIGTHKVGTFHGHALGSRGLQLAAIMARPSSLRRSRRWRRSCDSRPRSGSCSFTGDSGRCSTAGSATRKRTSRRLLQPGSAHKAGTRPSRTASSSTPSGAPRDG